MLDKDTLIVVAIGLALCATTFLFGALFGDVVGSLKAENTNLLLLEATEDCEELNKDYFEAAALVVGKASDKNFLDVPLSSGKTVRIPALRPEVK